MNLFQSGTFKLHSGALSSFKIDCDALTDNDLSTLVLMVAKMVGKFGSVEGVPTGGILLAEALGKYIDPTSHTYLIVDDVLTTGRSMEELRSSYIATDVVGAVLFARGQCPSWIKPLWQLHESLW